MSEHKRDGDVPLGEHWRRNQARTETELRDGRAERLRTSPPRRREDRREDRREHETDLVEQEEMIRRESTATVDLYAIDAMYAQSADNGMADSKGKRLAVEAAVTEAAQRRAGGNRQAAAPTQRDRARAAQRWEQNREYVESRHESLDRKQ